MKLVSFLMMGPTLGLFFIALLLLRRGRIGLAILSMLGALALSFGLPWLLAVELSFLHSLRPL